MGNENTHCQMSSWHELAAELLRLAKHEAVHPQSGPKYDLPTYTKTQSAEYIVPLPTSKFREARAQQI